MAFVLLLRTEAFLLSSAQLVPTGRFIDTMKENGLIEFRWHGRGGQGAKTACLLLADAAFCSGKYVQGFPEYGPERMGAPITAYNRISDVRCSVHCNIENPDYVVVVDETLLDSVDVTHGLSPEGAVIVNTAHSPAQIREKLRGWQGSMHHRCPPHLRGDAGQKLPQHPHAGRRRQSQRRAGGGKVQERHGG